MTKRFRARPGLPMGGEEKAVWAAAYGAAFAVQFENYRRDLGIDRADEITDGEKAAFVADRAVDHLRAVMARRQSEE